MPLATPTPADSLVHAKGSTAFKERMGAEFTRPDDRGTADTGTRVFEGLAADLQDFLNDLTDRQADAEYPGCGLDSFRVQDAPGNKRVVTLVFRGLIGNPRDADILNSSVFGTFSGTQTSGESFTIEFQCPQTEYRYVVPRTGDNPPNTAQFSGVNNEAGRKIRLWNLQPTTFGTASVKTILRLNKFESKPAGKAWEVTESWVRELSMPVNSTFTDNIPNSIIINPEESTS